MNCILTFKSSDNNYLYDTTIIVSVEPDIDNIFNIALNCDLIWVTDENKKNATFSFNIFPNPAKEKISISFSEQLITVKKSAVVKVFSDSGELIKIIPVAYTENCLSDISISTYDFKAGNYYCNLDVDGRKLAVSKFVLIK
ncbi:MAG: hypothetical protein PHP52_11880 [Bacteroidales bacterium]|nr:hypothetical protein [Bacteroidales bacterium]MDD4216792.1 hypothetical protein [Bacteroidales bacterium]MDY0142063.1 T9SS type A sorting domain-containing protein [Bacteroidales bacterium]